MEDEKPYSVVISSGNLDTDYLVAEIYNVTGVFIASVNYNGSAVLLDFTCEAENEVCKSERKINMNDFISAVNDSLKALELQFYVEVRENDVK